MPSWPSLSALLLLSAALSLSGCAAFRSYDREMQTALDYAQRGNVDGAIKTLESNNMLPDKDLLYHLELGMLQRMGNRYQESQKAWMAANARIQLSDQVDQIASLMRGASSYVLNDKLRTYEGHDYEKVMLLTYIALNHLALGDYDGARVAIKQTHELEAMIAEQRAARLVEVEEEARKRGARTSFKELNGYPVQTIDNPEVNALRNSYQSALSHYLAGFVYEALGEPGLAAPGYRLANELQPGIALLEEALRGLDERVAAPADEMTDVLFLVASGTAPVIRSNQFGIWVPVQDRVVLIPMSFPVMFAGAAAPKPTSLAVNEGPPLTVARLISIDLMARRQLQDDMPAIMLRATIRAATSAAVQYQAQKASDRRGAAGLAALLVTVGSALLATADERTWRTLPSEISIARARLPRGMHTVTVQTTQGPRSARVEVSGRFAVLDFWLLGGQLFGHAPEAKQREIAR
jgi:hypothetical protein